MNSKIMYNRMFGYLYWYPYVCRFKQIYIYIYIVCHIHPYKCIYYTIYIHIHPYTLGHSAQQPSRFHLLPRHRMDPWNFKGTCSASTPTVPSTWRSFPVWIQRKKQPHRLHVEILNAVNINPTSVEPWICQHSASICQHWWRLLLVLACFGHELRRYATQKRWATKRHGSQIPQELRSTSHDSLNSA